MLKYEGRWNRLYFVDSDVSRHAEHILGLDLFGQPQYYKQLFIRALNVDSVK